VAWRVVSHFVPKQYFLLNKISSPWNRVLIYRLRLLRPAMASENIIWYQILWMRSYRGHSTSLYDPISACILVAERERKKTLKNKRERWLKNNGIGDRKRRKKLSWDVKEREREREKEKMLKFWQDKARQSFRTTFFISPFHVPSQLLQKTFNEKTIRPSFFISFQQFNLNQFEK